MVCPFISFVAVAAPLMVDSQEGKGGNLLQARTIKLYNRYRTLSQHGDPIFPCKVVQFPHPPLLSGMDL